VLRRAPDKVFVFSGSADGKTLLMDRVRPQGPAFVDLLDTGLASYDLSSPRPVEYGQAGRAVYINGKRYCL